MAQKNEIIPLLVALITTGAIIGGGVWWFINRSPGLREITQNPTTEVPEAIPTNPVNSSEIVAQNDFPLITDIPVGTVIRINGATSMVQINELMKKGFTQQFPGTQIIANASGTEAGLRDLVNQKIDIAAMSRSLTPGEVQQGLVAVPVAKDAIAVFVGIDNPFRSGLTSAQVQGIFRGQIQNWSEIGGNPGTIRVINRAIASGTHQFFQEMALQGQGFGNTPNITTLEIDQTTPIIRSVGVDGISYATYSQVANQSQARVIPIDGFNPQDSSYPYQRILYYVYTEPASFNVRAFLGYLKSSQGQQMFQ